MFKFVPDTSSPGFRVKAPDDPPSFRVGNNGEGQRVAELRFPLVELLHQDLPEWPFPPEPAPSKPGLAPQLPNAYPLGPPPEALKNPEPQTPPYEFRLKFPVPEPWPREWWQLPWLLPQNR